MEPREGRHEHERESFRRMEAAKLREHRRRYRETTMGERIESAFELSALAEDLKNGLRRARG